MFIYYFGGGDYSRKYGMYDSGMSRRNGRIRNMRMTKHKTLMFAM